MSARVEEKVDIVDTLQPTDGLRKAAEIWLKFGSGDTIFDARRRRKLPQASSGRNCSMRRAALPA